MRMCMCICVCALVCVIMTTMKEIMNLRESKEVHRGGGRKRKGKCNYNFKNIIKCYCVPTRRLSILKLSFLYEIVLRTCGQL